MIKALCHKITDENLELNRKEIRRGACELSSTPVFLNLDLIGVCDMRPKCVMCVESGNAARCHDGMSISDILSFGKFLERALLLINCSIGEPLIYGNLVELVRLLDSMGKVLGFNTNALSLTRDLSDRLLQYPESLDILVSLDAANSSTYSKIRGRHFEKVIGNISYFCKKRAEINYRRDGRLLPGIGLCIMPMRVNENEILSFVKLASDLGVDRIELRCLNKIDKNIIVKRENFIFDYKDQTLSLDEMRELETMVSFAAKRYNILLECQYRSEKAVSDFFLPREFNDTGIKCILPWRFILPYVTGETAGCCAMGVSLGNWREEGLEKIWNSPRIMNMRKELATGELAKECLNYKHCPIVAQYTNRR